MKATAFCHMMRHLIICALVFAAAQIRAQDIDEGGIALSAADRQQYQTVLDRPMDAHATNDAKILIYGEKILAAKKLGDPVKAEALLREWALIEGRIKWILQETLAGNGKRDEAYQIGHQLIQSEKWPPNAARIRLQVARRYLEDGKIQDATQLINAAETIIKNDFRTLRGGDESKVWIAHAEMEFHEVKARLSMRMGKWSDGIENAKLAVEKGRSLSKLMGLITDEATKQWTYARMIRSSLELSAQQMMAGVYADAEWTLRDARTAMFEAGLIGGQTVELYNHIADLYIATGQFEHAALFAENSGKNLLETGFSRGSFLWLRSRTKAAIAYAGARQWSNAEAVFEQIDQETVQRNRSVDGELNQAFLRSYVYLHTGHPEPALKLMEAQMSWSLNNFGPDHYFTATSRGMWAAALSQSGQRERARREFTQALKGMTAPESLTGDFVENALQRQTKRYILESYVHLLAQSAANDQQDAQTIFLVADQLNRSSVQQALSEAAVRAGVSAPGLADIIRKEQDARNEVASLTSYISGQGSEDDKRRNPQVVESMRLRLRALETSRKDYKAQIQKSYPEYFQLIQPKSPSLQEIARQLRPDELFFSIVPMDDATYVWAVDAQGKTQFHSATLPDLKLRALVEQVRRTLDVAGQGSSTPRFDFAAAHTIYREIMEPFDGLMQQKEHLIIATSGALAQLPFAVLPRKAHVGSPSDASWLVKDLALSHVPSASGWLALKQLNKSPPAPEALLAWGDPLFDAKRSQQVASIAGKSTARSAVTTRSAEAAARTLLDADSYLVYSKIPPLPETRDEVTKLALILNANPADDLVLGSQATRQSVLQHSRSGKLASKRVVVFATHGLLAGDLPNLNQPALAMASTADSQESPLLTLEDVLGLKLNADWVVLSACNTAGADGRAEEALSGLARGFFYAGSRSLLVTHWAVESQSAMQLTTLTFEAYKSKPGISRSQALRQAMLQVMQQEDFNHPTYWAPYALVGEGGR